MYYYSVHSVNALSSHFGFWDRGVGEIPTTFRVRNLMSGSIPIGISDWGPGNPDTITWLKNHTEQENTAAFHSNERKHYIICGLVFWLRIVIIKKHVTTSCSRESLLSAVSIAEPQPHAWFVSTIPHHFFLFLDLVPFLRFGIPYIPGAPPWLFFLPASFSWNMRHASWLEKVAQTHPRVGKEGKTVGVKKKTQ